MARAGGNSTGRGGGGISRPTAAVLLKEEADMWGLRKRIPDREWRALIQPLFEQTRSAIEELAHSLESESLEDRGAALRKAAVQIPVLRDAIYELPPPTSSKARRAKREIEQALNNLSEGAHWGNDSLDQAVQDAERLRESGRRTAEGAPPGRTRFTGRHQGWESLITRAEERVRDASTVFSDGAAVG